MTATEASSADETSDLLTLCKAVAESLRLDILRVLQSESFGVMELCHIFDMPQPGMSHHLKILHLAGLLKTRREGNSIFYRRSLIAAADPLADLRKSLFDAIDQQPLGPVVIKRIATIHQERANNSRLFFQRNADKFKENQDLIARFEQYAGCIQDLISNDIINVSANLLISEDNAEGQGNAHGPSGTHRAPKKTVLEIGPGDSDLLPMLSKQFDEVLALDNSAEMLDLARRKAAENACHNVSFYPGELADLPDTVTNPDLIVLNMVLHHMASPSSVFSQAGASLKSNGAILIIDLCAHNQDWVRDICGDLWLGFEPQDMDNWAAQAGFEPGQNLFLGLKNGFQIQMKIYHLNNVRML